MTSISGQLPGGLVGVSASIDAIIGADQAVVEGGSSVAAGLLRQDNSDVEVS